MISNVEMVERVRTMSAQMPTAEEAAKGMRALASNGYTMQEIEDDPTILVDLIHGALGAYLDEKSGRMR